MAAVEIERSGERQVYAVQEEKKIIKGVELQKSAMHSEDQKCDIEVGMF